MEVSEAKALLDRVEEETSKGNFALKELGFWRVVLEAKKNPAIVDELGDRIGDIDQKAFKKWAWLSVSITIGHIIELIGTAIALALLYIGLTTATNLGGVSLVLSALILSATLHPFAHYLVGKWQGIDFTFYFPNGPALIEPTIKIDYASYLRAPAKGRVLMHLAGPIATSAAPLGVLVLGLIFGAQTLALAIVSLVLVFNGGSEFAPLVLKPLGITKIIFMDFRKTDTMRVLREWRIHKATQA